MEGLWVPQSEGGGWRHEILCLYSELQLRALHRPHTSECARPRPQGPRGCHRGQREQLIGPFSYRIVESNVPTKYEVNTVGLVRCLPFEPLGESQRIHRFPPLIENNHFPFGRNRAQQLRRIGVHDKRITFLLSTFLGCQLCNFNRKEVLDSIEVTVDSLPILSVRCGTNPNEV